MIRTHRRGRLRALVSALAATLMAGSIAALAAAPAHAEPVTITDPVSGVSITLSSDRIAPGERIQISGTGFVPTSGSSGDPLVAVRPYDYDEGPAWTIGGPDAYFPANTSVPPGSEAKHWFVTDHTTTSFEGWIQAPTNLTKAGPLGNGQHWLRILSGAFFTTTGDRLTDPITFRVPFTVADKLETGLTSPTGVYQQGTYFRPNASITLRGRGYTPNAAVTVSLDGTALASSITADADGGLPNSARVTLPADLSTGQHTLRVATGAVSNTLTITGTKTPTAAVPTTTIRSGGTIAYDLDDYIGVGGKPQKVAVVVDEQVIKCVTVGADGSAVGAVAMPATDAATQGVRFNVGLSCLLPSNPSAVIDDMPISTAPHTLTVSADAPRLGVTGSPHPGGRLALSGSGFDAGSSVAITVGTTPAGTLTANSSGEISGNVTAPATAGEHRVLATGGSKTAAALATVVAKAPAKVALKLAKGKVKRTARASATIKVSVKGAPASLIATGKVSIYDGKKKLATYQLKAKHKGVLTVKLPKIKKKGNHKLQARYAGDANVSATTSKSVTLKVV